MGIWRDSSKWRSLDGAEYGGSEEEVSLFLMLRYVIMTVTICFSLTSDGSSNHSSSQTRSVFFYSFCSFNKLQADSMFKSNASLFLSLINDG